MPHGRAAVGWAGRQASPVKYSTSAVSRAGTGTGPLPPLITMVPSFSTRIWRPPASSMRAPSAAAAAGRGAGGGRGERERRGKHAAAGGRRRRVRRPAPLSAPPRPARLPAPPWHCAGAGQGRGGAWAGPPPTVHQRCVGGPPPLDPHCPAARPHRRSQPRRGGGRRGRRCRGAGRWRRPRARGSRRSWPSACWAGGAQGEAGASGNAGAVRDAPYHCPAASLPPLAWRQRGATLARRFRPPRGPAAPTPPAGIDNGHCRGGWGAPWPLGTRIACHRRGSCVPVDLPRRRSHLRRARHSHQRRPGEAAAPTPAAATQGLLRWRAVPAGATRLPLVHALRSSTFCRSSAQKVQPLALLQPLRPRRLCTTPAAH